jgi:HlyD family secretion protein
VRRSVVLSLTILAAAALGGCTNDRPLQVVGLLEWDRIELKAEAAEPIVEVLVSEGDRVSAGQAILRQDPARVEAQRDEARAARDQAAARLAELRRGPRTERIQAQRAEVAGAESLAATAQKEMERIRSLLAKQLSTPEALDEARAQRDQAVAARDAGRALLKELLAGTTAEELQQAEAALAQAEARLQNLQISLERLTIRASRTGRLDSLPFKLGDRPEPGAVVAVLLAGSGPYARVYVPEPLKARVAQGGRARVWVDGIEEPFQGRVRMTSADPAFTPYYSLTERDRSRLSYPTEITLEGERAGELPAGVPLRAEFLGGSAPGG